MPQRVQGDRRRQLGGLGDPRPRAGEVDSDARALTREDQGVGQTALVAGQDGDRRDPTGDTRLDAGPSPDLCSVAGNLISRASRSTCRHRSSLISTFGRR